jgi:aminoglycoside phosphotransferase (APT) family kinase protein
MVVGTIAVGQTLIILTAGIDLSCGTVMALADVMMTKLAAEHGVPTPPVRAVLTPECGLGEGYITDFVAGETIARRLLREPEFAELRANFAAQCGEIAGRIHRLDAARLPFLRRFDAEAQVAAYRGVYESYALPIPALEVALRWAEDNIPPCPRLTVVHGDFRMGNAICGPDRIRALLDWEIASLGDPMQDLGWLCTKTWRFGGREPVGGIGRREDLFAAYERAAGVPVDRESVRFWEAWGSAKWGIMCLLKGQAHRRTASERTVEAFAIGRRMEEPLHDFFAFLAGEED